MSPLARYAGLVAAPAAWAASVQAGQILPYADCARGASWTAATAGLALVLALASAAVSLAGRRRLAGTERFLAGLAGLLALSFALALLFQTAAAILLDPCAR